MLGVCLAVLFAVSAMAAVPALAKKTKYSDETWEQYKNCPYNNPAVEFCVAGITSGGKSGGFFQLGQVEVPLSKPVTLQGGAVEPGCEGCALEIVPATNGETVESAELPVRKGLKLITPVIEEQDEWPQALRESLHEAIKNKEAGLYVKIEEAGNTLYENPHGLNTQNLIEEEGNAFELPLKVKLTGPWLSKLGDGPCTVGNEEHPIMQDLTSADGGDAGHVRFNHAFTAIEVDGSRLVNFGWQVEPAAGATGCGGEYETYVNEAINQLSWGNASESKGFTVLQGTLYNAISADVKTAAEEGKV